MQMVKPAVPFGCHLLLIQMQVWQIQGVGDRGELYLSGLPEKDGLRYHQGRKTPQQNASSIIHFRHPE